MTSIRRNIVLQVKDGTSETLYNHILHPIYSPNSNVQPVIAQEKQNKKSKNSIFRKIKSAFSKKSNVKKESKNLKPTFKKNSEGFILPHLQNPYIAQHYLATISSTKSKDDNSNSLASSKTNDNLGINNESQSVISNREKLKGEQVSHNVEINQIKLKSETGSVKSNEDLHNVNDKMIENNEKGPLEAPIDQKATDPEIISYFTKALEQMKKEKNYSNDKIFRENEGAFSISNETIFSVPPTSQKLLTYDKSHSSDSNFNEQWNLNALDKAHKKFQLMSKQIGNISIKEGESSRHNDEDSSLLENKLYESYQQQLNDSEIPSFDSNVTNFFIDRKNFSFHEEVLKTLSYSSNLNQLGCSSNQLSSAVNVLDGPRNIVSEYNSGLYSQSKTLSFPSNLNKSGVRFNPFSCILNDFDGELKKKVLENHFGFDPNEIIYEETYDSQNLSESKMKRENEMEKRKPLLSQPNEIPIKQLVLAPQIVWSRAASPISSDINNIPIAGVNPDQLDLLKKILPPKRYVGKKKNKKEHFDTMPNTDLNSHEKYGWVENESDLYEDSEFQKPNKPVQIQSEDRPTSAMCVSSKNILERKQFTQFHKNFNIFETYQSKRDAEHSGLNISLQQFKDLKNNLCITLCRSTIVDERKMFNQTDHKMQFEDNNFKATEDKSPNNTSINELSTRLDRQIQSDSSMFTQKCLQDSSNYIKSSTVFLKEREQIKIECQDKQPLDPKLWDTNKKSAPKETDKDHNNKSTSTLNRKASSNKKNKKDDLSKKDTRINKLIINTSPDSKNVSPINGFIKVNKHNDIRRKSSKQSNVGNASKKKKPDTTKGKSPQKNPHGTFTGNLSGAPKKKHNKLVNKLNK